MATPKIALSAIKPPKSQVETNKGVPPSIVSDAGMDYAPSRKEIAPGEDYFQALDEQPGISGEEKKPKQVKEAKVEKPEVSSIRDLAYIPPYNLLERARAKFAKYQTPDDPLGLVRALKSLEGRIEPAMRAVPNFEKLKPAQQEALIQAFAPVSEVTPEEEAAMMSMEGGMSKEGAMSVERPRMQIAARSRGAFDSFAKDLIKREGGYVNRPDDAGGETKFGISKRSYPKEDIKNLTKEKAIEFYKADYWDKVRGDDLPDQIARVVADIAVNSGVGTIINRLNKKYGTKKPGFSDDLIYAITQDIKERGEQQVASDLINEQEDLYFKLAASPKRNDLSFIEGWINRANELREQAGLKRNGTKADTNAATKEFQQAINAFLDPKDHIAVDGTIGAKTKKALTKLKPAIRKRLLKEYFAKLKNPQKVKRGGGKKKKKQQAPRKRFFLAEKTKEKEKG